MGGSNNQNNNAATSAADSGVDVKVSTKGLPAVSIPEFDPITPKQEELIREFMANHDTIEAFADPIRNRYASMFDYDWTIIAKKFLVSRKWNVKDAGKMYDETIDFRTKRKFHEKPHWPPAFTVRGYDLDDVRRVVGETNLRTDAMQKDEEGKYSCQLDEIHHKIGLYHPKVIHYWDKTGHPVWIEKIPGKYKDYLSAFKSALRPPMTIQEAWEEYHWHQSEVSGLICKYQNLKRSQEFGREITSVTVVMDCQDLGYGVLFSDVARLSDKVWSTESKVVPEALHRIFLVNCPAIINIAFGLLKHVVPKRTQEKIIFCNKDRTREVLTAVIDEDKLPKELGGTCECVNGCLGLKV